MELCQLKRMKNQKTEHNSTKRKRDYGTEKRRNEKKPCIIHYDDRDMDGADGVAVDVFFTEYYQRTVPRGENFVLGGKNRRAGIAHL